MKLSAIATPLGLAALAIASNVLPRDFDSNDYYVLHLDGRTSPTEVARSLGLSHEGPLGELQDHHLFVGSKAEHDIVKRELTERRRRKRSLGDEPHVLDSVLFSEKQILRKPWEKRMVPRPAGPSRRGLFSDQGVDWAVKKQNEVIGTLGIKDPIFKEQWHLFNTVQTGHDVNVTGLWLEGITGKNATVAIVDDGLDMETDDLKDNYYAQGSWDFNDKVPDPKPRLSDDKHGTRCAGEVSAGKNNACGVGVAYDSRIAGLRILSKLISDSDEAVAMNYDFQHNQIYSCSWGPPDDGQSMDAPGILIKRAMLNAVQKGRGGLGSIYVFASGNGAGNGDNCNFDGYTNSIYSITVGAVDRNGDHPYYSESCSANLVVTYSSGGGDSIHTTDVGNACSDTHGGTSAAAPLAAGIFALVLQVRPDLSWRDMQHLTVNTAVPINLDSGEWQTTAIGKQFSHMYGYGKLDSYAIVQAAKTWKKVKPQAWFYSPWIHVNKAIPQGDTGVAVTYEVTQAMLDEANLERLEHITVTMNIAHTRRGDLSVDLISPNKLVSHLSVSRKNDEAHAGYDDWTFMSVLHWGETGVGNWTIIVKDTQVNSHEGVFTDWHLKLWGESKDASKAKVLPMPTEEDDNDHAVIATTTLPATTTTLPPQPIATDTKPTTVSDHPNRPVNSKPTPTDASSNPSPTSDEQTSETTTPTNSTWLPSFLPTFGKSAATMVWVYGSAALIGVFCISLAVYFWLARRKRLRNNPRGDYEFELLDEEEAEGLAGGGGSSAEKRGAGGAGGLAGGKRTRGGELYDAFAGGSDDEDVDDEVYRDRVDELGRGSGSGSEGASGSGSGSGAGAGAGGRQTRALRSDSDDESGHHVVGDDDDESDSDDDGHGSRPLRR
ncbi:peptidase S8/S53 domain-containing protein [Neurospora tetraspora]|uniref:Peptidase S8/S53 domain-containing protein n=1 Tax=Neurospora tetraspora TaxID=94610 RepID=A0AAE0MW01_9PEZI|nr:peptidase S8/S53 domain-containing protein [Neurospora tetraspora]